MTIRTLLLLPLLGLCALPCSADVTGDYFVQRKGSLVNLNLNAQGKSVAGYFLECTFDSNRDDGTKVDRVGFSGSINGANLRLSGFLSTVWTGTAKGGVVTMKWPLASGEIEEVTFKKLSPKAWNTKLTEFKRANKWKQYLLIFSTAIRNRLETIMSRTRGIETEAKNELDEVSLARKQRADKQAELLVCRSRITEKSDAVSGQVTEVARLEDISKATGNADDLSRLRDARSKLRDLNVYLRDEQNRAKEIEERIQEFGSKIEHSEEWIASLNESKALYWEEARLITTVAIRDHFQKGKPLPVKAVKLGKSRSIQSNPGLDGNKVYDAPAGSTLYLVPTMGAWSITLLKNHSIGWIRNPS